MPLTTTICIDGVAAAATWNYIKKSKNERTCKREPYGERNNMDMQISHILLFFLSLFQAWRSAKEKGRKKKSAEQYQQQ